MRWHLPCHAGVGAAYPPAGATVGGLRVLDDVPNLSSIPATLGEYEELPGIREVSFSLFTEMGDLSFYSRSEKERVTSLAEQIRASGEIKPLIVAIDEKGPYVLEGGHRFDALRMLGAGSFPAVVVMDKSISRDAWVRSHCKFAQDMGQQLVLPFHDPSEYTAEPTDVMPDLMDYAPEGTEKEDWAGGFWHVTTNLPAVLYSGELKSRSQLGGQGVGLGGGFGDVARNKVSVTHSRQKADALASAMKFAADVAHGLAKPSLILSEFMGMHGAVDEISQYSSPNLYAVLISYGVSENLIKDEPDDGLEAWLDANVRGGQACYEFMQEIDEALLQDAEQLNEYGAEPGAYSGFTMPYEAFAGIDPKNIGVVQVVVRRDAAPEHVPGEAEMRFDPRDVMLLQDSRTIASRRLAQQQYLDFYEPKEYSPMGEEHWPDPSSDALAALGEMIDERPGELEKFLAANAAIYEPRVVSFERAGEARRADPVIVVMPSRPHVVELGEYPEVKEANDWLADVGDMNLGYYVPYRDFNKDFWESVGKGQVMYHATDPANVAAILEHGLEADSRTRGMSNRSMGAAVFTSSDPSLVSSYGDAVVEIDVGAMRADGYMPKVSKEEPFEEEEMRADLACRIGLREYCPYAAYSSEGLDPETVAFFGDIPAKYLKAELPMTAAWVARNCRLARGRQPSAEVSYVPIDPDGEDVDQAQLDAAWALAKNSGIRILRDKALVMIAIADDIVVGALWASEGGYGRHFSFDVAVHPDWRRMGIGSRLAAEGRALYDPEAWPEGMELDAISEGGEALSRGLGLNLVRELPGHRFYAQAGDKYDFSKAWERPGGGKARFLDQFETSKLLAGMMPYMDSVMSTHPFFSRLVMEPEHPRDLSLRQIMLRYSSAETPYSKSMNQDVIVDVVIVLSLEDPPAWMKKSMGWSDEDEARRMFRMAHSRIQYYDADTGKRIGEAYKSQPTSNVGEALEYARIFAQNDLIIDKDGGEKEPEVPTPGPAEKLPTGKPQPALAWIRSNCRFAQASATKWPQGTSVTWGAGLTGQVWSDFGTYVDVAPTISRKMVRIKKMDLSIMSAESMGLQVGDAGRVPAMGEQIFVFEGENPDGRLRLRSEDGRLMDTPPANFSKLPPGSVGSQRSQDPNRPDPNTPVERWNPKVKPVIPHGKEVPQEGEIGLFDPKA